MEIKPMKKTFTGWISKKDAKMSAFCWIMDNPEFTTPAVFKYKNGSWGKKDIPPVKVKITVEIVK